MPRWPDAPTRPRRTTGRSSMPTGRSDRAVRRRGRLRCCRCPLLLLRADSTACGDASAGRASRSRTPTGVAEAIQRALDSRARPIVAATGWPSRAASASATRGFVAEQDGYFENLGQLPLGTRALRPRPGAAWSRTATATGPRSRSASSSRATTSRPSSPATAGGSPRRRNARRYLLTSTTDAAVGGRAPGPTPAVGPRRDRGARRCGRARDLRRGHGARAPTRSSRRSRRRGSPCGRVLPPTSRIPAASSSTSSSDPAFLASLEDCRSATRPLDGATVPGAPRRGDGGGPVSSYRIVLQPAGSSTRATQALDRLVRHELTHVAARRPRRGVPLWLSEGLAEYVSVRPIAPAERRSPDRRAQPGRRRRHRPPVGRGVHRRRMPRAGTPCRGGSASTSRRPTARLRCGRCSTGSPTVPTSRR